MEPETGFMDIDPILELSPTGSGKSHSKVRRLQWPLILAYPFCSDFEIQLRSDPPDIGADEFSDVPEKVSRYLAEDKGRIGILHRSLV